VNDLIAFVKELGLTVHGTFESPIRGAKGNREFFIYLKYPNKKEGDNKEGK